MGEFDLIDRFFKRPRPAHRPLGIGDDCALLAPGPGMQLAVSSDMLVEGRHFLSTVDAFKLGHKALAVEPQRSGGLRRQAAGVHAGERACALAGFVQSLASWFLEELFMPQECDYMVYTYNRFQSLPLRPGRRLCGTHPRAGTRPYATTSCRP